VPADLMEQWRKDDPLLLTRNRIAQFSGLSEKSIREIEESVETEVREVVTRALEIARPRASRAIARACRSGLACGQDSRQGSGRHNDARSSFDAANAAIE